MRIKDALGAVIRKKERGSLIPLATVWSEQADDEKEIPLQDYPRPQMKRNSWECLNGWWEYAVTGKQDKWKAPDGHILVPFSPECRRSGVGRVLQPGEALWYRRTVEIPETGGGRRLLLHFGAVDERCQVWWNGKFLGSHRGGYLPFSFDVTDHVRAGCNELILRVLDDTDTGQACRGKQKLAPGGMFYTPQSGIWQTVWMEYVPESYVSELKITPAPERKEAEIRFKVNGTPAGGSVDVFVPVCCGGDESGPDGSFRNLPDGIVPDDPADTDGPIIVRPFSAEEFSSDGYISVSVKIGDPAHWTPETPYLYPVVIRCGADRLDSYFAMRSFGTGTDADGNRCLTLNGEPYFFNGILDQGYWPESLMTAPADGAFVFDILKMKALGFNMLRKHVKIEPLRWYYHCDRLGMAVWQDMVNGGGPVNAMLCTYAPTAVPAVQDLPVDRDYRLLARQDASERARFEEQLNEMIDHLYNVPSIGMWVIFNEGWGQFDTVRLTKKVKEIDRTRPVDHASGWFDHGAGDVKSVHNYFRELTVSPDRHGRAFVISEYGGLTCTVPEHVSTDTVYGYHAENEDTFGEKFREMTEKINALKEQGLAGAVYTQLSDIEEEINGLLTYDRKTCKVRD